MAKDLKLRIEGRLAALHLNPFEAARACGLERNFINDILTERKRSVRGENLSKLAKGLQTTEVWLLSGVAPESPEGERSSNDAGVTAPASIPQPMRLTNDDIIPRSQIAGAGVLPIYASTQGGPGITVMNFGDPIDYVPMPARLQNVKGAYGLYVVGESMSPVFEPGDTVQIHPHLQPRSGDYVVIYRQKDHDEMEGLLKRLRRATGNTWYLFQFNPAEGESAEFELDREEWPNCHVVIGKEFAR